MRTNGSALGQEVKPVDSLSKFKDSRKYSDRLTEAVKNTGETEVGGSAGTILEQPVVIAAFEFDFMGGSMGSVVGERFVRGVRHAIETNSAFISIRLGRRTHAGSVVIPDANGENHRRTDLAR